MCKVGAQEQFRQHALPDPISELTRESH